MLDSFTHFDRSPLEKYWKNMQNREIGNPEMEIPEMPKPSCAAVPVLVNTPEFIVRYKIALLRALQ